MSSAPIDTQACLGTKMRGKAPRFVSTNKSSFPPILAKPVPSSWFRRIVDRTNGNLVNPFMRHGVNHIALASAGPSQCFVLIKQMDSLVRTRFESTVRRPRKALERAAQVRPPTARGGPLSPRSSSSSPPKLDGSFTLETRCGYEYDRRERYSLASDFQGSAGAHRHHQRAVLFQLAGPYLRRAASVGAVSLNKDNSSRGPRRRLRLPNVAVNRRVPLRILTRFPFEARAKHVSYGIRTDGSSAARALGFTNTAAPSYSSGLDNCPDGRRGLRASAAIHFLG
ncbi:hypothetical protein Syun_031942 [Stephania yunnanensis]|uniref:Uncharacterized protein n=1 Tax=Stephania yunnanensis TaxID=152371 RepID=A0AAP0HDS3_9MAGN